VFAKMYCFEYFLCCCYSKWKFILEIFCLYLFDQKKFFFPKLIMLSCFSFTINKQRLCHNHTHVYICTDTQINCNSILSVMYICYSTAFLANGGVGYTVFAFRFLSSENLHVSSFFLKLYI